MINNLSYLFASLAAMNVVLAQNSTENVTSLQWLNSLLFVPNAEMQNEMLAAKDNVLNLNPEEVTQTACIDERGRQGVCVMHYQCQPISRSLIKDGGTLLDTRENANPCPNLLEVCCMTTPPDTGVVDNMKRKNTSNSAVSDKCNILSLFMPLVYYLRF